ncbi:hypothetical protein Ocin01_11582 [Orchesella cincta]|uniref:TOG domain-containing protein n=1 Tax=Orchesella cincta TaxID=48709 RepID=A0A1D2MQG7_ORCCI|nr:hypothetical protein Ocin01_11582 [Orchesella cincta]
MDMVLSIVLALAVAAQAGVLTTSHQIHDITLSSPVVHHVAPAVLHTSSSSSYKYRAPAAKVLTAPIVHHAPIAVAHHSIPIVHSSPVLMSHDWLTDNFIMKNTFAYREVTALLVAVTIIPYILVFSNGLTTRGVNSTSNDIDLETLSLFGVTPEFAEQFRLNLLKAIELEEKENVTNCVKNSEVSLVDFIKEVTQEQVELDLQLEEVTKKKMGTKKMTKMLDQQRQDRERLGTLNPSRIIQSTVNFFPPGQRMMAQMIVDSLIGYVPPENRTTRPRPSGPRDYSTSLPINESCFHKRGNGSVLEKTMQQTLHPQTQGGPVSIHKLLSEAEATTPPIAVHEDDEVDIEKRLTTTLKPANSSKTEYKVKVKSELIVNKKPVVPFSCGIYRLNALNLRAPKMAWFSNITPRLMPSASKYRRPNLPSILADKAAVAASHHPTFPWHNNPRLPKLSIPTPAKPVTMPSFAKCIPGTKRTTVSRMESSTCFPIIPSQSGYHTVSMVKEQTMEPSHQPPAGMYINPYPYLLSPMGYSPINMMGMMAPQHNYSMSDGSGDHHNQTFYPHQGRCYEPPCPKGIFFQQNPNCMMPDAGAYMNATTMAYPQSPYATQSMPNFGPPVAYTNNLPHVGGGGYHHSFSMPNCNMTQSSHPKHGNSSSSSINSSCCPSGGVLPPEPQEMQGILHPVNSVSMPDICMGPPEMFPRADAPQPCNSVPTIWPDSLPTKIPTNPRVTHSPIQPGTNEELDDIIDERICNGNGCCSQCKCCQTKNHRHHNRKRSPSKKFSPRRAIKHNNSNNNNNKPVVVAVHDCFPSDSSESEGSDVMMESPRKSCFNYSNSNNNAVIRKRKPRIDTILHKTKPRGDSEEVFDELSDLSPDEVRLYTCEYLTELLSSDDWENCYNALQTMVRMARHRPKTLLNYLGPILWFAFKHLTSPKSALCRAAIVTFRELFQSIGSALDNDLEKLTEKLVIKSLAPNKFIREECDRALEAMVRHCSLLKVLTAMEIVSKKPHVRAACQRISKMTKQFVEVATVDTCLKSMYAEKLLPMLFSFMTEANNETRTAAKEALAMLMNHLQFENAVTKFVTFDRNCTEVFKKLDKMRGRNRSNRMVLGGSRAKPLLHYRK